VAFGVVNTRDSSSVAAVRARIEEFLAAQIPEGRGWTELLFLGQEPPGTLEIRLSGQDIDTLYQSGKRIEDLLATVPGTKDLREPLNSTVGTFRQLRVRRLFGQELAI
jgi:hypothetical protein